MTSAQQTDMERVMSLISISASVLSFFTEVFIIVTYLRFQQLRPLMRWIPFVDLAHFYDKYCAWSESYCQNLRFTERFPLYLHIAIANALRDSVKILGDISEREHYVWCQFQGFAVNYGGLCTFWWIATIGWVMHSAIFYPKAWKHRASTNHDVIYQREKLMIWCNYGIPFIVSLLPLFSHSYGNVDTHCWIREEAILLRWLCFYIHLIAATVYCCVIYYLIGNEVKDKEFGKLFERIRWYPFCLTLGFGFSVFRRGFGIIITEKLWFGQLIHALSTGLFGISIFFLVGRSRGSFKLTDDTSLSPSNELKNDGSDSKSEPEQSVNSGGFRAAVFGLSDGLATNLCLILGVHFALESSDNSQIVTSGIAGLFGGAISMAIGEYVSVRAQSDATNAEIAKHKYALRQEWDKEMCALRDHLSHILSEKTIDSIIEDLKKNDSQNKLEFYSKIVLGIDPDSNSDNLAVTSAMYSFGMFSFGALIPLSPYFWFHGQTACIMAIVTSLMIAIVIGATIGYFSKSNQKLAMQRQFFATVIGVSLSIAISKVFN